jgi:hypothetical protein
MFCSQWYLTLFSYRYVLVTVLLSAAHHFFRFPLEIVFRIYDNILANGIEAIFIFSINLLSKNESMLLSLKFDEILAFLNHKIFDSYLVGFSVH